MLKSSSEIVVWIYDTFAYNFRTENVFEGELLIIFL